MTRYIILLITIFTLGCDDPLTTEEIETALEEQDMSSLQDFPKKPIVHAYDPRFGPWTGSNNLGQSQLFAPDANNRQRILEMPEWGPPKEWTLSLGIEFSDGSIPGGSDGLGIVAEVTFGAGGSTQQVLVDWNQGTTLTVTANSFYVTAIYTEGTAGVADTDLRLSVQAGVGTRPGNTPRLTQKTLIAAGLFNNPVRIPAFARRALFTKAGGGIVATDIYQSTIIFQTYGNNGASVFQDRIRLDDYLTGFGAIGFPFNSQARYWNLTNGTPDLLEFNVIWELGL